MGEIGAGCWCPCVDSKPARWRAGDPSITGTGGRLLEIEGGDARDVARMACCAASLLRQPFPASAVTAGRLSV